MPIDPESDPDEINEWLQARSTCALWYWRHHGLQYLLCDSESEAASFAEHLSEDGEGAPEGVQFSNGVFIHCGQWEALRQVKEEREAEAEERIARAKERPPPLMRSVRAPFTDDRGRRPTVLIPVDEPDWLGHHPGGFGG